MNSQIDKCWLIDGLSGQTITFRELLEDLMHPRLELRQLCRPSNTRDALLSLTKALMAGTELTLFDTDFTDNEIMELGYDSSNVNIISVIPGFDAVTIETLEKLASGGSKMRLNLFTSGSSGVPKRVEHPISILARSVRQSVRHSEDVWALAFNPTHVAGVQVWLQAMANSNTIVDVSSAGPEVALAAIEQYGVTHLSATPTFYRLLLTTRRVFHGVCSITLGGEISDERLHRRLLKIFPNAKLHNIYASTETGTLLLSNGEYFSIPEHYASLLKIHNGCLHVHRSLLGQFYDQPLEDGDSWYNTGDIVEVVTMTPMSFRFVAQTRDGINVGGLKVNPREVEEVINAHPAVVACRVFGRPNAVIGQLLCAEVLSTVPVLSEADLRQFLIERLQPVKIPRIINFVEQIGATRTGKILRR